MKKNIILSLVVLGLLTTGLGYLFLTYTYSSGHRVGKLVKLSKKGFVPKTWEGIMDLGSGDQLTWQFSVHKDDIGHELSKHSGKMVRLEYRELLWKVFYETKYDVIAWKIIRPEEEMTLLCRLVNIMRKNSAIVEMTRPLIEEFDQDLMINIRECQRKHPRN